MFFHSEIRYAIYESKNYKLIYVYTLISSKLCIVDTVYRKINFSGFINILKQNQKQEFSIIGKL